MPSLEHETLVELFSRDPRAAVSLLQASGKVTVPSFDTIDVRPADERELTPASLRVDVVILLRKGEPVFVILLEVQLGRDDDKPYTWPFYVAAVRLRYRCPVCLLVYAPDDEVARWGSKPIDLGQPDSPFVPLVVRPQQVPRIEHKAAAEQLPYAALLSAVAHGHEPNNELIIEAVWAALRRFNEDDRRVWVQLLSVMVNETAKKILEAKMDLESIKRQLPFFIEGKAEGKAEGLAAGKAAGEAAGKASAVVAVLAARGLVLTEEQRTKITSEVELATLERWLLVALKAERVDELWAASS